MRVQATKGTVFLLVAVVLLAGCSKGKTTVAEQSSALSGDFPVQDVPPEIQTVEEAESPKPVYTAYFDESEILRELSEISEICGELLESPVTILEGMPFLDEDQVREAVARIGAVGYTAVGDQVTMENPDRVRGFYREVEAGRDADLALYAVDIFGTVAQLRFHGEGGELYFARSLLRRKDGRDEMTALAEIGRVNHLELTEKGYLFYGVEGQQQGEIYGLYLEPVNQAYRLLRDRYILPLDGYAGHNVLVANWDGDSLLDTVNFSDVFAMLYYHDYGESPFHSYRSAYYPDIAYINAIPGDVFEDVICHYFPVENADLRERCVYDAERQVYAVSPLINAGYSPTPEVVDAVENDDGSLTLTVHALRLDKGDDQNAVNWVTVLPREDRGFYYVSNTIERRQDARKDFIPAYFPRVEKEG